MFQRFSKSEIRLERDHNKINFQQYPTTLGPPLPRPLYDYEVWSQRKKDLRRLRTLLALSLALLALALVVSAGAVLAALGTN